MRAHRVLDLHIIWKNKITKKRIKFYLCVLELCFMNIKMILMFFESHEKPIS